LIDDQDPPKPEHRNIHIGKLLIALTLEGATFSLIRGIVSHGSRHAYTRLTGSWPGDEQPEASEQTEHGGAVTARTCSPIDLVRSA